MLQKVHKYTNDIKEFFSDLGNEDYLKNYFSGGRPYSDLELYEDDEWGKIARVSVGKDNKLIGYYAVSINRTTRRADNLGIIKLDRSGDWISKKIFVEDLLQFIDDLFIKYNMNKLSFSVYDTNKKAKAQYEKMLPRMNGRKIGYRHQEILLFSGELVDEHIFEVMKDNYLSSEMGKKFRERGEIK